MTQTNGVHSLSTIAGLTPIADKQANAVKPQPVAHPVRADQANLSEAGALAAQSGDDVRWNKVQALQDAIGKGTYQVPAAEVASKLVDSLLE